MLRRFETCRNRTDFYWRFSVTCFNLTCRVYDHIILLFYWNYLGLILTLVFSCRCCAVNYSLSTLAIIYFFVYTVSVSFSSRFSPIKPSRQPNNWGQLFSRPGMLLHTLNPTKIIFLAFDRIGNIDSRTGTVGFDERQCILKIALALNRSSLVVGVKIIKTFGSTDFMNRLYDITHNSSLVRNWRVGVIGGVAWVDDQPILCIDVAVFDTEIRTAGSLVVGVALLNCSLHDVQRRFKAEAGVFVEWSGFSNMVAHSQLLHSPPTIELLDRPNLLPWFFITPIPLIPPTMRGSQPQHGVGFRTLIQWFDIA